MTDEISEQPDHPLMAPLLAPGGPVAVQRGCRCSVLANAAFRAGAPDVEPLIDPSCAFHRATA